MQSAIAARPHLSADQRLMVEGLCQSGCGVDAVLGPPGSGKTAALDAARAAWRSAEIAVIGTALSAKAAAELEAGSGIRSATVAALLRELAQPESPGLPRGGVIVVDEAAMIGTRALHQLHGFVERSHGKLVLAGDPAQLPAIEAGGAFAAIVKRVGAFELTGNYRQQDAAERAALARLRIGDVDRALSIMRGRNRVIEAADAGTVRQQLVNDWYAAVRRGERAIMLAVRRGDVEQLNAHARALFVADGVITGPQIETDRHAFASGDVVVAGRNDRRLGVVNGDGGVVQSVVAERQAVVVRLDRGAVVELPHSYLRDGQLQHGYATTIHKAQGMTCDVALLLGNDVLFREAGYTGLSRGRNENRLYVVASDPPEHDAVAAMTGRHPADALVAALRRRQAKSMAIDCAVERHGAS